MARISYKPEALSIEGSYRTLVGAATLVGGYVSGELSCISQLPEGGESQNSGPIGSVISNN